MVLFLIFQIRFSFYLNQKWDHKNVPLTAQEWTNYSAKSMLFIGQICML